jgi:hypothetical protein
MSIFNFFRRRNRSAADRVNFTDDAITRVRPDGITESISWNDLHEVAIATNDNGPWSEDVFFVLSSVDGKSGCVVPQGAEGSQQLLVRLQDLPGFDNAAVIEAMGSTSNAKFVCWKRQTV